LLVVGGAAFERSMPKILKRAIPQPAITTATKGSVIAGDDRNNAVRGRAILASIVHRRK
jgi:hypothetical protein